MRERLPNRRRNYRREVRAVIALLEMLQDLQCARGDRVEREARTRFGPVEPEHITYTQTFTELRRDVAARRAARNSPHHGQEDTSS
jgi:hypothetical protein